MIIDELARLELEEKNAIENIELEFKRKRNDLKNKYNSCSHEWGTVEYVPEKEKVPKYETAWQGVDCCPKLVGFSTQMKDRWARQCKKCGKVEYTYKKNKPIPEYEF